MFLLSSFHFLVQSARLRERAESGGTDEDEDESDEDDQIEEELGFISPLDTVNPYTSFKQALTSCVVFFYTFSPIPSITDDIGLVFLPIAFQMQNSLGYQASTTILDIEQQTMLMEVMRIAEQESGSLS